MAEGRPTATARSAEREEVPSGGRSGRVCGSVRGVDEWGGRPGQCPAAEQANGPLADRPDRHQCHLQARRQLQSLDAAIEGRSRSGRGQISKRRPLRSRRPPKNSKITTPAPRSTTNPRNGWSNVRPTCRPACSFRSRSFYARSRQIYSTVYQGIKQEVDGFCSANGIAIVLKFNREPINNEKPDDVLRGINSPVVWNAGQVDITQYIIDSLARRRSRRPPMPQVRWECGRRVCMLSLGNFIGRWPRRRARIARRATLEPIPFLVMDDWRLWGWN